MDDCKHLIMSTNAHADVYISSCCQLLLLLHLIFSSHSKPTLTLTHSVIDHGSRELIHMPCWNIRNEKHCKYDNDTKQNSASSIACCQICHMSNYWRLNIMRRFIMITINTIQLPTLMGVGVIGATGDLALCLFLVRGEGWEPGTESATTPHPRSGVTIINLPDSKDLFPQGAGADCDGDDIDAEACTGDGQGSCEFEFPPAWKPEFSVTKVADRYHGECQSPLVSLCSRLKAKGTLRACCWVSGSSTTSVWTSQPWTRTGILWWRCSQMTLIMVWWYSSDDLINI